MMLDLVEVVGSGRCVDRELENVVDGLEKVGQRQDVLSYLGIDRVETRNKNCRSVTGIAGRLATWAD
jgi:hypothetical protein